MVCEILTIEISLFIKKVYLDGIIEISYFLFLDKTI